MATAQMDIPFTSSRLGFDTATTNVPLKRQLLCFRASPLTPFASLVLIFIGANSAHAQSDPNRTNYREGNPQQDVTIAVSTRDKILSWWQEESTSWHFAVVASTGYLGENFAFIASSADLVDRSFGGRFGSGKRLFSDVGQTSGHVEFDLNNLKSVRPGDRVLLYFIGHGDRNSGTLRFPMPDLPLSGSWTLSALLDAAKKQNPMGVQEQFSPYQLILILDSCYSGLAIGADSAKYRLNGVSFYTSTAYPDSTVQQDASFQLGHGLPPDDPALQEMAAHDPVIQELAARGKLPSAFSYYLARAFNEDWKKAASESGEEASYDGVLTLDRLDRYISSHLDAAKKQKLVDGLMTPSKLISLNTGKTSGGFVTSDPVIYYSPDDIPPDNKASAKRIELENRLEFTVYPEGGCDSVSQQRSVSFQFLSEVSQMQSTAQLDCENNSWLPLPVRALPPGFKTKVVKVTLDGSVPFILTQKFSPDQETPMDCRAPFVGSSPDGLSLRMCLNE